MKYSKWLEKLSKGRIKPASEVCGICMSFAREFNESLAYICMRTGIDVKQYEYYSGDKIFPVRGGQERYMNYKRAGMSLWEGDYGKDRLDFAKWLADQLRSKGL